jgi:hypothetical protein
MSSLQDLLMDEDEEVNSRNASTLVVHAVHSKGG